MRAVRCSVGNGHPAGPAAELRLLRRAVRRLHAHGRAPARCLLSRGHGLLAVRRKTAGRICQTRTLSHENYPTARTRRSRRAQRPFAPLASGATLSPASPGPCHRRHAPTLCLFVRRIWGTVVTTSHFLTEFWKPLLCFFLTESRSSSDHLSSFNIKFTTYNEDYKNDKVRKNVKAKALPTKSDGPFIPSVYHSTVLNHQRVERQTAKPVPPSHSNKGTGRTQASQSRYNPSY